MNVRYKKYIDTDPEKAKEYLLSDLQDTSRYVSAQAYTDNVMNVALPSTYRFMEKVIQEIVAMYKETGAPLTTIIWEVMKWLRAHGWVPLYVGR